MKELKALEVLKMLLTEYRHDDDVILMQESIAELEALQAPKTCDGCKYEGCNGVGGCYIHCSRNHIVDYYEPKEAQ